MVKHLITLCPKFTAKSVGERILKNRSTFGKIEGKNIVAFLPDTVWFNDHSSMLYDE